MGIATKTVTYPDGRVEVTTRDTSKPVAPPKKAKVDVTEVKVEEEQQQPLFEKDQEHKED